MQFQVPTRLSPTPLEPAYAKIILNFQQAPPVDVVGLAEALGIRVWELSDLPATVSGKLFRDPVHGGSSQYSIGVNANEHFERKRFTVAHEIAHYILHRNKIQTELVDDTMYRSPLVTSAEEAQANKLAADILMPLQLIQKMIQNGVTDVDVLANLFQVSGTAMRIRLGVPVP